MRAPEPPPALDLSRLSEIHVDPTTGENDADSDVTGTSAARPIPAASPAASLGRRSQSVGAGTIEQDAEAATDPRLRPIDPALLKGVSRNAPCPCGSGKKFKHCHGSF